MRKPLLLLAAAILLAAFAVAGCRQADEETSNSTTNGTTPTSSNSAATGNSENASNSAATGNSEGSTTPAEGTKSPAEAPKAEPPAKPTPTKGSGNLYAVLDTSLGSITCQLFEKEAPITVANFKGLAEGTKEWTEPDTGKKVKKPFYNGLCFHRVIPDFMIQGGCPLSNDPTRAGTGDPGYKFGDEFAPNLQFDKVGRLAMANSGPGTNGSQFFITVAPTPHLNGRHTIFGQVVKGQDVADTISRVPTQSDRPLKPVFLRKVTFYRASQPK